MVAGVKHTFAFGGLHGAKENYFAEGIIVCFDVASLYPSIMINYGFLSRNVREPKKFAEIRDTRLELKRKKDKKQGALKIVINATYGASKDPNNALNDPLMANNVCICGQLLLLDLIEKIEDYGELIQSNTDGVYMLVKDMETVDVIKSIAKEWEDRTDLVLEWDLYSKIYQRDVNNYIIVDANGHYKSKGCVKKRTAVDYDMPILTKAVINYCVNGDCVEDTINNCDDLIEFQKIVKITSLYKYATHGDERLNEKVLRVFASKDENAKGVFKVKSETKIDKLANTPDKCFINNENIRGVKCPPELDKEYYINLATKMLADFLGGDIKKVKVSNDEKILSILKSNSPTFYDILELKKLNTKITDTIFTKYIKIDVFKRYGECKKLMNYMMMFKLLYNKKSAKGSILIKTIQDKNIINILRNNSEYNDIKDSYAKLESKTALMEIWEYLPNESIPIFEKVRQEFQLYDDITIKDDNIDENIIFVMNVNQTKNQSIIAYNLKHGTTNILKIPKSIFNILEIHELDFIMIKSISKKPKVIVIDKDEEGINVIGEHKNEVNWWINEYEILDRDYGKNGTLVIDTEVEDYY